MTFKSTSQYRNNYSGRLFCHSLNMLLRLLRTINFWYELNHRYTLYLILNDSNTIGVVLTDLDFINWKHKKYFGAHICSDFSDLFIYFRRPYVIIQIETIWTIFIYLVWKMCTCLEWIRNECISMIPKYTLLIFSI